MNDDDPFYNSEPTFAQFEPELFPEEYKFIMALQRLVKRESDICPYCGKRLTSLRQSVRSVYGSCGCRLYCGFVPEIWRS